MDGYSVKAMPKDMYEYCCACGYANVVLLDIQRKCVHIYECSETRT